MQPPTDTTGSSSGAGAPVQFPPTIGIWTVIIESQQADPERAQVAMGKLCEYYYEAILGYFRLKCRRPQDAEDLAGAFIQHLLEKKRLKDINKEKCPRFRAYLAVSLKNFFLDRLPPPPPPPCLPTPPPLKGDDIDLPLALAVHRHVMAALKAQAPDPRRFELLREFTPFEHGQGTYEQAARDLGISVEAVRKGVHDLRAKYVRAFRAEVAQTVVDKQLVDDETRCLIELLPEAVALDKQATTES